MAYNSEWAPIRDGSPKVTLRKVTDPAETASAAEAPVEFDQGSNTYWKTPEPNFNGMLVVFHVKTVDTTDGDETYKLEVEVADDQAFTTNAVVLGGLDVKKTGQYVVTLHGPTVRQQTNDPRWIRAKVTIGGVTASIEYGAWITQSTGIVG